MRVAGVGLVLQQPLVVAPHQHVLGGVHAAADPGEVALDVRVLRRPPNVARHRRVPGAVEEAGRAAELEQGPRHGRVASRGDQPVGDGNREPVNGNKRPTRRVNTARIGVCADFNGCGPRTLVV